ncbi:MAG: sigma-70 family RNA polymerase sigma factor [Vicinamibacteria bacterium]
MLQKDGDDARALLESHLEMIRQIIGATAARKGLAPVDEEELDSFVISKLLENDGVRLRRFRGESSWKTYLTIVIQRLFLDFQRQSLGKWPPSRRATELGPLGEKLEICLARDGLSFDEVHQKLLSEGIAIARDELRQLSENLPPGSETNALESGPSRLREKLQQTLREAITRLPLRDALVLMMWFERGMTAPQIARAVRIPPRDVYTTIRRSTGRIRKYLESRKLEKLDVMDLLGSTAPEMDPFSGTT